jgi:rod shape-determining protein MreD
MTAAPSSPRAAAAVGALAVAVVLQVSVLPHLWLPGAFDGFVPGTVLLVVVAAGLRHGSETAMALGFGGGLLLDLVPPADHVAGRWALALLVAGYVAGRLADSAPRRSTVLATVAACSFVATSLFALTGLLLRDPVVGVPVLLEAVAVALVLDVVLGALLVPALLAVDERLEPDRLPA